MLAGHVEALLVAIPIAPSAASPSRKRSCARGTLAALWGSQSTGGQIRTQFLSEAVILALIGGAAGVAAGALATIVYASTKGWAVVIPAEAWTGGIATAIATGAIAGLLAAIRAARLSPTEALANRMNESDDLSGRTRGE